MIVRLFLAAALSTLSVAAPAATALSDADLHLGLLNLVRVEEISFRLMYQRATKGALKIGATPAESARLLGAPADFFVDPWGTPYRIEIDGPKFRIVGAGSDRKFDPSTWSDHGQFADLAADVVVEDGSAKRSNYTWLFRMVPDPMEQVAVAAQTIREAKGKRLTDVLATPALAVGYLLMIEGKAILLTMGGADGLDILRAEETATNMAVLALRLNEYSLAHGSLRPLRAAGDPVAALLADSSPRNEWVRANDEWGTPFRVDIDETGSYRIASAGADRRFDPQRWSLPIEPDPKDDQVYTSGAGLTRQFDPQAFTERLRVRAEAGPKPAGPRTIDRAGRKVYTGGEGIAPPELIRKVAVQSPKGMGTKVSIVAVEAVVDETGKIVDVNILTKSDPAFERAVRDALPQWVYRPGTLNGKPVPVLTTITLTFTP